MAEYRPERVSYSDALAEIDSLAAPYIENRNPLGGPSVLDQFSAPAPVELSPQEQAAAFLNDPTALETAAAAIRGGNNLADNPLISDIQNMSYGQFALKYGVENARSMHRLGDAQRQFEDSFTDERRFTEQVQDAGLDFGSGVLNTLGGAGALVLGTAGRVDEYFDPENTGFSEMAVALSNLTRQGSEALKSWQSPERQEEARAEGVARELDASDNAQQYESDLSVFSGGDRSFAGLRRIGRGILEEGDRIWNNPSEAVSITAEGLGSLGPSVGIAKLMSRFGKTGAAVGVGVVEAGGSYTQALQEVMGMDEQTLMVESPTYRAYREQGRSHEEAVELTANVAGTDAAAVNLPAAALAARAVVGFETSPIASALGGGLTKPIRNVTTQAAEEAFQGAIGEVSTNVGLRGTVDGDRSLTEGVGEAIVQGAVGGLGMAGVTQGPGVATRAAAQSLRATVNGATNLVNRRLDAVNARVEADGDASTAKREEAIQEITSDLVQSVAEADTTEINPETVMNEVFVSPEQQTRMREEFGPMGALVPERGNLTHAGVVENVADALTNENLTAQLEPEQIRAGQVYLHNAKASMERIINSDLGSEQDSLKAKLSLVLENKKIDQALKGIETIEVDTSLPIQEKAGQTIDVARVNPASISVETIDEVIAAQEAGEITMAENEVQIMKTLKSFQETNQRREAEKEGIVRKAGSANNFRPTDLVRAEITDRGNSSNKLPSLSQHTARITNALATNDTTTAQEYVAELGSFAQHMLNKVDAMNTSLDGGRGEQIPFRTKTPFGWVAAGDKGSSSTYANVKSDNSMAFAEEVLIDANTVRDFYNQVVAETGLGQPLEQSPVVHPEIAAYRGETEVESDVAKVEPTQAQETPETEESSEAPQTDQEQVQGQEEDADAEPTDEVEPEAEVVDLAPVLEQITTITDAVSETHGVDLSLEALDIELVVEDIIDEVTGEPFGGYANYENGEAVISLSEKQAENLSARLMMHEIAHIMDFSMVGETGLEESQKRTYYENGDVYNEVQAAMASDTTARAYFDYAMRDPSDATRQSRELFAELMAMYLLNPEGMEQNMPVSFQQMQEFIDERFERDENEAEQTVEETEAETFDAPVDVVEEDRRPSEADPVGDAVPELTTLDQALPSLVQDDRLGGSRFLGAYTLDADRSDALVSPTFVEDVVGLIQGENDLPYALAGDQKSSLTSLIREDLPKIKAALNKRLSTITFGSDKRTIKSMLESGRVFNSLDNARVVNLVDTETQQYADPLMDAALMGFAHWLMNARSKGNMKAEDAAKIFNVPVTEVTQQMLDSMNDGVYLGRAMEDMVRSMEQFAGLRRNNTAPIEDTQGIMMGLAAEIVATVEGLNSDMLSVRTENINGKDYNILDVKLPESLQFGVASNALRDLVTPNEPKEFQVGTPIEGVEQSQRRNSSVALSEVEKQAEANLQKVPFLPNLPLINLVQAFQPEAFSRLMGEKEVDEQAVNVEHWKTLKGKNRTIRSSIESMYRYADSVRAYAEKSGTSLSEVPTYYRAFITKVGRLHMEGDNPQSDKLLRETSVSTVTELDLNDPAQNDQFWMTVAQSSGLVKTELVKRGDAVAQAQEGMEAYRPSIDLMKQWLGQSNNEDSFPPLTEDQQTALNDNLNPDGNGAEIKLIHSVMAVAQYELAKGTDGFGSFKHMLSLEADGKTNGPVNALMNFMSGGFTKLQMALMNKGGVFLNEAGTTLNDHVLRDPKDIYETAADEMLRGLRQMRKHLVDTNDTASLAKLDAVMRMMSHNGEIALDEDGEIVSVGRKALKNPLTVSIYGSGLKGINGKVMDELLGSFGEQFTELMRLQKSNPNASLKDLPKYQSYPELESDLNILFDGEFPTDPAQTRRFSPAAKTALFDNLMSFYAEPMEGAINAIMADTIAATSMIQLATDLQSVVFKDKFEKRINEAIAEKAGDKKGHIGLLSQAEINEILDELKEFGAIIETETQTFDLSSTENAQTTHSLARTLDGKYSTKVRSTAPTLAGVKASAYLNIGTGDGRMITKVFTANDLLLKLLPVFDGIEIPADAMDTVSEMVNRSVYEAWQENPIKAVADSFASFIREGAFDSLSTEAQAYITQTLERRDLSLEMVQDTLLTLSDESQARKAVMAKRGMTVDQMASAESPHYNGQPLIEGDQDKVLDTLNKDLKRELEKIRGKASEELVPAPSAAETKSMETYSLPHEFFPGVRYMTLDMVKQFRRRNRSISRHARDVMKLVEESLPENTIVFLGSSEDLTQFRNDNAQGTQGLGPIEAGQFDTANNAVYLVSTSGETMAHELIHAATFQKVYNHYADGTTLSKEDRNAINRLEGLMNEFLMLKDEANADVQLMIRKELANQNRTNEANQAIALNEFMAWSLTNQSVINTLRSQRTQGIMKKALAFIKRILGNPGKNMFEQIRFNTQIILENANDQVTLPRSYAGFLNQQNRGIMEAFQNKLVDLGLDRYTQGVPTSTINQEIEAQTHTERVYFDVRDAFPMDFDQEQTFKAVHTVISTSLQLNPASMSRLNTVYANALKQIKPETFLVDPETANDAERDQARQKYEVITGKSLIKRDNQGRTNLLATFVALSQSDPEFRIMLNKLDMPKDLEFDYSSTNDILYSLGSTAMNFLETQMANPGQQPKATTVLLDQLARDISKLERDKWTWLEKKAEGTLTRADSVISAVFEKGAVKIKETADRQIAGLDGQDGKIASLKRAMFQGSKAISFLLSGEQAKQISQQGIALMNKMDGAIPIRELIVEIVGQTDDNKPVDTMVKRVRSSVDQIRQAYREILPRTFAEQFSRKMLKHEWETMYKALAQTDIASLGSRFGMADIAAVFKDETRLDKEITDLENSIRSAAQNTTIGNIYLNKAAELGEYLSAGKPASNNFQRNAYAIANLAGEDVRTSLKGEPSDALIDMIDQVATLYALKNLDANTVDQINRMIETERQGMEFTIQYLAGTKAKELEKAPRGSRAYINGYKGFIPADAQDGASVVVREQRHHDELVMGGYTRVGVYRGSGVENQRLSYYTSSVAGANTYSQGAMQTVQMSYQGVDMRTGRSLRGTTAGMLTGPYVQKLKARLRTAPVGAEPLLPIYDDNFEVVAYERSMDPRVSQNLKPNTRLDEMIGAWRGRQQEEVLADQFNQELVGNLKGIWDQFKTDQVDGFINVADADDPVIKDIWKTIPDDAKKMIEQAYGEPNLFMVRKDMLNNAIGYRNASVTDLWTGDSRLNKSVADKVIQAATIPFGENAFKYLKLGESGVQYGVSTAKNLIVVRSVIIPVFNLLSNQIQLLNKGVPVRMLLTKQNEKLVEINQYLKNRERMIKIEALLMAGSMDRNEEARLNGELKSLEDANNRMSIKPLLDNGEFSTISEGITEVDAALMEGKWTSYIEGKAEALPDSAKTAWDYFAVNQNTALYQGLDRAVQYGDFLAKATLFDWYIQQGMSEADALDAIGEQFVDYNKLPGRTRTYLESVGLMWFWNFKLRTMKIAGQMLRENPVRSALAVWGIGLTPSSLGLGSPITDNALGKIWDGGASYSIGPSMGFSAWELNPWMQMIR